MHAFNRILLKYCVPDICLLAVEVTTRCAKSTDHYSSYYFDGQIGQCVPYATGGCGANANKFDSLESCRKTCSTHLSVSVPDSLAIGNAMLDRRYVISVQKS